MTDNPIPGYLGRVLTDNGEPAGTCFQVAPGVVVTAWHVLDKLSAGATGDTVQVDTLASGTSPVPAHVMNVDALHDLAVLQVDEPFAASVAGLAATDAVAPATGVQVLGVSTVDDEYRYRYTPAVGTWQGPAQREDQIALGVMSSRFVALGMSGAPVRRRDDDAVVGVVSARYNSADGWLRDAVWLARVEDLLPLLAGVAEVAVVDKPLGPTVDLVLTVSETSVRLHGTGVAATAAHRGVTEGLRGALQDTWRARARASGQRGDTSDVLQPAQVSLRRAGQLLAESFLPSPVADALAGVLRRAASEHRRLRIGIEAPGFPLLPWEALPDPLDHQPLALRPLVTVYRRQAAPPVRAIPGPLRIVVAIAAPSSGGGPELDYERELRNVHAAVRGARAREAQVRVVQFATTAAIRAALAEADAHVLHLTGHGDPGVLILEDESGAAREVPATTFVDEAIPADKMPPVISLAACHTTAPSPQGGGSFAAALVEHGASVVIGTETSVTDRYATKLFARVYAELASNEHPDVVAAVADARRLVQRELDTSTDHREQGLGLLDEWSTVTVLAGHGVVRVYDPAVTEEVAAPATQSPRGLLDRGAGGDFVGRRREQRELPASMLGDATHGVVLYGIGGVGKTTLAAQLVRRIQELEPRRLVAVVSGELSVDTVFAEITGTIRRNLTPTGTMLRAVEFASHVDERWQDRFTVLREHVLDAVPLLIVVDNFEDNLTDDPADRRLRDDTLAGLLGLWVADPGRSRLLITSRFEFTLPDDAQENLVCRPVGPMSMAETFKLIWSLPALDRLDNDELERVWRMVGGHPRTLEYLDALLAGGHARFVDVTRRITQKLRAAFPADADRMLATSTGLDQALATTLTLAADDVLLDALLTSIADRPHAQRLLLGLSVYREPVDDHAALFQIGIPDDSAAHVPDWRAANERIGEILTQHGIPTDSPVSVDDLPPEVVTEIAPHLLVLNSAPTPPRSFDGELSNIIAVLEAASLLIVDPDTDHLYVHRWTASELARRWRDERRDNEIITAHRNAAAYWLWRVDTRPQDKAADAHDRLEARHHLIAAGDLDQAAEITELVCDWLHQTGALDHESELIHDTLRWLDPDSPRQAAWIHQLGMLAQDRGDYPEAEHRYTQSLQIKERLGNQASIATSYHQLGMLAQDRGDYPEAEHRYTQSLQIEERLGNQAGMATSYHQLGILAYLRGDYPEAEHRYTQSLTINERLGNQAGMANSYHQLGILAYLRGDYPEAEHRYTQSLQIEKRLGNQAGMASSYGQLGILAQHRGDYPEAERRYTQALTIFERLGNQAGMATSYHQLGILAQDRGDYPEAERRYTQSLQINERLGNQAGIADSYHQLGNLAYLRGDYPEAEHRYTQSLEINERLSNQAGMATTLSQRGLLASQLDDPELAVSFHIRALSIRLRLEVPQASIDVRALVALRRRLGPAEFARAAGTHLDAENVAALNQLLDTNTST